MRRSPTTSVLPLQMAEPAWLGFLVRSHGCSYSYCGLSCFPFVGEVFFFMCSAFCYSVMTLVFLGACSITAAVIAVIGTFPAFVWVRALTSPRMHSLARYGCHLSAIGFCMYRLRGRHHLNIWVPVGLGDRRRCIGQFCAIV